ncbi:MAG: alpha/beta hydrolase-fold protein, partial [Acidobacteriota bacterium]
RAAGVYLPAGYDEGDSYPLLVVLSGTQAVEGLGLANALDQLFGNRLPPAVVAVVGPQGFNEYRREPETALKYLKEDLLPALEARYKLAKGPEHRALWGYRDAGYLAIYSALMAPETFGGAAAQGFFVHADKNAELIEHLGDEPPKGLRLYVDWSAWDNTARAEKLAAALDAAELSWSGGLVEGTSEWHDLAARIDQPLAVLLPAR